MSIIRRVPRLYIGPTPKPKKNSTKIRYVFDTREPLKSLLKKINLVFLKRVDYPSYLTGSLPGRDFAANVEIHAGASRVVTEDIKSFFDYISADNVYRTWRFLFGFSHEVAELLTLLTTKDGKVCQGTPTSSYLANLAFWDRESALVKRLAERGIRYSRYVDDVTISSTGVLTEDDKRWAIAQIYGMIGSAGFKVQRAKHSAGTARNAITIMGLNANSRNGPTLTKKERSDIRAMVFQLELKSNQELGDHQFQHEFNKGAGKVGRLKRFHPNEGRALRNRLDVLRANPKTGQVVFSNSQMTLTSQEMVDPPF